MAQRTKLPRPVYNRHGVTLYRGDCRELLPQLGVRDQGLGARATRPAVAPITDHQSPISFIFTDPPYGADQNKGDLNAARAEWAGHKARRAIAGDSKDEADALVRLLFAEAHRLLPPGGVLCCCCHGSGGKDLKYAKWSTWLESVMDFQSAVVWDKGPMGLGWRYRRSYELVLVASRPGGRMRWFDESHKIENIVRHIRKVQGRLRKHPTQKPVALAEHFIKLHTLPGEVVLDPFAGGGSTLAAAVRTGRRAIGIELDGEFCEAAIEAVEGEVTAKKVARE